MKTIDLRPSSQKFQPGDEVRILWERAHSTGNFRDYGCASPLKIKCFLGPMGRSMKSYMVYDSRGVTDVVSEDVMERVAK